MTTAAVISTIKHNIGDDFVREGLAFLLKEAGQADRFEPIHKHSPVTVFYGLEWFRNYRFSRRIWPLLRLLGWPNRIEKHDLLVQSGAPVYWCHPGGPHCADNEWFKPLVLELYNKKRGKKKLISVAGGSCQRFHSNGAEITNCKRCRQYIEEFYRACDVTLLRDDVAKKMLNALGLDAEVLPCTSIFARDQLKIEPKGGEYIVLNFMENGGHFTFGQDIDSAQWRRNFVLLANKCAGLGRTILACHTEAELALARKLLPKMETFLVPDEHVAFMEFYSAARFAVVNRVHAAFMLASLGKVAVVIGNDSRARMVSQLNLRSYYVSDVTADIVDEIVDHCVSREHDYAAEADTIRRAAKIRYVELLNKI